MPGVGVVHTHISKFTVLARYLGASGPEGQQAPASKGPTDAAGQYSEGRGSS